jgi:hypothetical protein
MVEAQPEQLVVQVMAVGAEGRAPFADATRHHHQRVHDGQPQEHQRHRGTERLPFVLCQQHGQYRQRETEELAAAVAHEDASRPRIEPQEAQQRAAQRHRDDLDAPVAAAAGQQAQRCGSQQRRPTRQAVETVGEVDRIRHAEHEQDRQRHPHPVRQRMAFDERHGLDLHLAEDHHHGDRDQLAGELDERRQVLAIVPDAEREHDHAAGEVGQQSLVVAGQP